MKSSPSNSKINFELKEFYMEDMYKYDEEYIDNEADLSV